MIKKSSWITLFIRIRGHRGEEVVQGGPDKISIAFPGSRASLKMPCQYVSMSVLAN